MKDPNASLGGGWDALIPSDIREDTIIKFFRELTRVKNDSRLLVIVTHGFVELLTNTLVEAKCKNGKKIASSTRDYPHSVKLLLLNELGLLADDFYSSLDWLRKIRNKAAHQPFFEITKHDLQIWRPEFREPSNFYTLCTVLVAMLWNEHLEVFGPIFGPGVTRSGTH